MSCKAQSRAEQMSRCPPDGQVSASAKRRILSCPVLNPIAGLRDLVTTAFVRLVRHPDLGSRRGQSFTRSPLRLPVCRFVHQRRAAELATQQPIKVARPGGGPDRALQAGDRRRPTLPCRGGASHRNRGRHRGPQPHARFRTSEVHPRRVIGNRERDFLDLSNLPATRW